MAKKTFIEYQGLEYGALHIRGEVADITNLPASNNELWDCYRVIKYNTTYVWVQISENTFRWKPISTPVRFSDGKAYFTDFNENNWAATVEQVVVPNAPTISPSGASHNGNITVTLSTTTTGATIRYTTDGTEPTESSTAGASFVIYQDDNNQYKEVTVKAAAFKFGQKSSTTSKTFTIQRKLSNPTISVVTGTDEFDVSRDVKVTGATGSTILYTTDNTAPSGSSSSAASPATITVGTSTTSASGTSYKVRAIQRLSGWADSAEGTAVTVVTSRTLTHIGWKSTSTIDVSGVESLTSDKRTSLAGTYTVPNSTIGTAYLYFCFPSGWSITTIKSGGFDVPVRDHGTIGSWHVYSVDETATGGTFEIQ